MTRRMVGRWAGLGLLGCACSMGGTAPGQTGAATKDGACVKADGSRADSGKGCSVPDHVPSVAEQFPFPGEVPAAPAKASAGDKPLTDKPVGDKAAGDRFPYPGEAAPEAPTALDGVKKTGGAADRFPYPGEKAAGGIDGGSSSSSSSSGGDAAAAADGSPGLKDEGSEGDVKPHRRRLRGQAQKTLSDDERVAEDLSVAHYYQQSGNTMGAYLRAKDAVKLQPDAGDTHLALAEAADRLGKRDEAIAEYTAALGADLDEDGAKAAKKGLARLKR